MFAYMVVCASTRARNWIVFRVKPTSIDHERQQPPLPPRRTPARCPPHRSPHAADVSQRSPTIIAVFLARPNVIIMVDSANGFVAPPSRTQEKNLPALKRPRTSLSPQDLFHPLGCCRSPAHVTVSDITSQEGQHRSVADCTWWLAIATRMTSSGPNSPVAVLSWHPHARHAPLCSVRHCQGHGLSRNEGRCYQDDTKFSQQLRTLSLLSIHPSDLALLAMQVAVDGMASRGARDFIVV